MRLLKNVEILQGRAGALHRPCPDLLAGCTRKPTEAFECRSVVPLAGGVADAMRMFTRILTDVYGCSRLLTLRTPLAVNIGRQKKARLEARGPMGKPRKAKVALGFCVARLGIPWLPAPEKAKESQPKANKSQGARAG